MHFEGLVVVVASFKDLKVGCLLVGGGGNGGALAVRAPSACVAWGTLRVRP